MCFELDTEVTKTESSVTVGITPFTSDLQVSKKIPFLKVTGPTLVEAFATAAKGSLRFIHVCDAKSNGESIVGVTFAWIGNDRDRRAYNGAYYKVTGVTGEAPNLTYELSYDSAANSFVKAR